MEQEAFWVILQTYTISMITLPHLVTSGDIFSNFDSKKIKGKGNLKKIYKCKDKNYLARKIFSRYLHYLFSDMVEGGKVFMFPTKGYTALKVRQINSTQFKKARKAGAYKSVDILASNFKCYEICMNYKVGDYMFEVPVKMNKEFVDRMIEKMNEGYNYA